MPRARRIAFTLVLAALVAAPRQAVAATPAAGTVSEASPSVQWTGGPFVVSNPVGCVGELDPACDNFLLTVTTPSFSPFAVIIEIDSTSLTPDQDDYDLVVYDADGNQVDDSGSPGAFERVVLFDPAPGTYRVEVLAWSVTPASTYAGKATLLSSSPPPLVSLPPADPSSIFATPTLVDSQLHTGEPSIAVSPVVPADGSRPLIVGDAPWGTSNATSLWWRSRDGGASFELVQDPLAAPRPRPCEEVDGGGDSDTAFDHEGRIYINDLAALINIPVGVSDDGFQTASCSKLGGTNPVQPIQDRQWIVAAPDADGAGPEIDAYVTFRRGLVDGNPVTERAIQIYATRDGGHNYEPVGEIVDFFGFANSKVSQTGNPVVDTTDGPRRGTLYHSYYLASTAKVGRYDPSANTFDALTVAERFGDVGNVFPALAIDQGGNLYYAWVEGGAFDVHLSISTDGGDTWSDPVRLNLPGESELAVNPFIVAGSPGRVAVLFNGTGGTTSPDGAAGRAWHLYVAQSTNALDANPTFTQHRVTDTPLHFNSICTGGLGCDLSQPPEDRSLLEFNEVDVDPSDGSMVFIFADNGRRPQPPLAVDEIPQPYIMATRQIAGESMIAGKTVRNTLPRVSSAFDPAGDATYPKAGTAEGPNHPALDLLSSRLEATATGVQAVVEVADLSDLAAALDVTYGTGDPRLTQKAIWVTRFEVVHQVIEDGQPVTREEVYALGMELDRAAGGPTFWYGTPGVARNALLDAKRSSYGSGDGQPASVFDLSGNTFRVEIPYAFMGLDLEADPDPVFHSVTTFALAQPEAEIDGQPVAVYFNNQRTVDATRAYDWVLGEETPPCIDVEDTDPAVEYFRGWHRRQHPDASAGTYHRRMGSANGSASNADPFARVTFEGDSITYFYVKSDRGGTADIVIDGEHQETLSYGANLPGPENPTFGHSRTYSNLGPGQHVLEIRYASGAVYVDGFGFSCAPGAAADASAAAFTAITEVSNSSALEGPLVARSVTVGTADEELSVVVEGSALPVTVNLLAPSGDLVATGGALVEGGAVSGLDAAVGSPGTYTVQVLGAGKAMEISTSRTVRVE